MIEVSKIKKNFGEKTAVDGISFSVKPGEVLGFLGPNGAGKSTTMRMITGFFEPDSGSIKIQGVDTQENSLKTKAKIGYLPENAPLYNEMTVFDFLNFVAEVRGLNGVEKSNAIDRVVELCHLKSVKHQLIDTISKGYKHRTCLAQALIHDPDILILDEPTDGLDPNQKHGVRTLIRNMGEKKVIIFSTHILEEVEAACSRAIIIDSGKIVADGTPDELKAKAPDAGSITYKIRKITPKEVLEELKKLKEIKNFDVIAKGKDSLKLQIFASKGVNLVPVLQKFTDSKKAVLDELSVEPGRLDLLFRSVTKSDV